MTKFRRTASSNLKMKQMLLILSSFTLLNISKCMKMMNGNIPKSLRVGHQNLGSGIVSNKLSDIDYLLMEYKPHILGISETNRAQGQIECCGLTFTGNGSFRHIGRGRHNITAGPL